MTRGSGACAGEARQARCREPPNGGEAASATVRDDDVIGSARRVMGDRPIRVGVQARVMPERLVARASRRNGRRLTLMHGRDGYRHGNPRRESKPHAVSSIDAVLRQVVAQRALADAHQLGRVLLDAARLLERAADGLALHPFEVLVQPQRRQARRAAPTWRRAARPTAAVSTGPVASTTARSIVFSSSRTLPGQS